MKHTKLTIGAVGLLPLILTIKSNWPKIKKYIKNITLVFLAVTCWTYIFMISANKIFVITLMVLFFIIGFVWGFLKNEIKR